MSTGKDILKLALTHEGDDYVLGVVAPKDIPGYQGPFDCAEMVSYDCYQILHKLYGCGNNQGNPHTADAGTVYWGRDSKTILKRISISEASKIPGAILLRGAEAGQYGHIVFCVGDGNTTMEANSTRYGCIKSHISGRRWSTGLLIPGVEYGQGVIQQPVEPPYSKIYFYDNPMMRTTPDGPIGKIQNALGITADGIFGPGTEKAVRNFQVNHGGLVADGEVGPLTWEALGL